MTTTIIETVSSETPTITFTDVWDRDLLIVGIKLLGSSGSADVTAPAGWTSGFYTGIEATYWIMPLVDGANVHTFTVTGATSQQLLGIHLRSDVTTGPNAFPTRSAGWGETLTTIGADDALIGWSWVRDMAIDLTTPGFTLVDQTSHVAVWAHEPLQVPVGTSLVPMAASNTPVAVNAWRVWAKGTAPVVAGAGGWTGWIID